VRLVLLLLAWAVALFVLWRFGGASPALLQPRLNKAGRAPAGSPPSVHVRAGGSGGRPGSSTQPPHGAGACSAPLGAGRDPLSVAFRTSLETVVDIALECEHPNSARETCGGGVAQWIDHGVTGDAPKQAALPLPFGAEPLHFGEQDLKSAAEWTRHVLGMRFPALDFGGGWPHVDDGGQLNDSAGLGASGSDEWFERGGKRLVMGGADSFGEIGESAGECGNVALDVGDPLAERALAFVDCAAVCEIAAEQFCAEQFYLFDRVEQSNAGRSERGGGLRAVERCDEAVGVLSSLAFVGGQSDPSVSLRTPLGDLRGPGVAVRGRAYLGTWVRRVGLECFAVGATVVDSNAGGAVGWGRWGGHGSAFHFLSASEPDRGFAPDARPTELATAVRVVTWLSLGIGCIELGAKQVDFVEQHAGVDVVLRLSRVGEVRSELSPAREGRVVECVIGGEQSAKYAAGHGGKGHGSAFRFLFAGGLESLGRGFGAKPSDFGDQNLECSGDGCGQGLCGATPAQQIPVGRAGQSALVGRQAVTGEAGGESLLSPPHGAATQAGGGVVGAARAAYRGLSRGGVGHASLSYRGVAASMLDMRRPWTENPGTFGHIWTPNAWQALSNSGVCA